MRTDQIKEKDILHYLLGMRVRLLEEIKSIEVTINAISPVRQVDQVEAALLTETGKVPTETTSSLSPFGTAKILRPQETFDPFAKLDLKISYALTNLGNGFKEDILEVIKEADPEIDLHKLENAVAVRLSYLLSNGLIAGNKIGRRYEYALIEPKGVKTVD